MGKYTSNHGARKPVVTERTSKKWKAVILLGVLMTAGGLVSSVAIGASGNKDLMPMAGLAGIAFLLGIPTYIVGRFGQWWFHG